MKHITTIIVFVICILAVGSWTYAQGRNGGCGRCRVNGAANCGANFVDKNGDGICDNAGLRGAGNGRGQGCRFRANTTDNTSVKGPNFVDKNGDGICDNIQQTQE
jgi:hypothetical protein